MVRIIFILIIAPDHNHVVVGIIFLIIDPGNIRCEWASSKSAFAVPSTKAPSDSSSFSMRMGSSGKKLEHCSKIGAKKVRVKLMKAFQERAIQPSALQVAWKL